MNSTHAPALRQLETTTRLFRDRLAKAHRSRWVAEHKRARAALDVWDPTLADGERVAIVDVATGEVTGEVVGTALASEEMRDALSVARWHHGRDNGQKYRFKRLADCGKRMMIAQCKACDGEKTPVPEGCGIARLCERCSLLNAKKRRGRFGRARQRISGDLARIGYTRSRKKQHGGPGGLWSDKMITLSLPHFLLCHVDADAPLRDFGKGAAVDATMARIYAVRAAWPLFARSLRAWFKRGGTAKVKKRRGCQNVPRPPIAVPLKNGKSAPPPMHRAFEWTPGKDGLGHPHFHIWLLAPFIPKEALRAMWRTALIEVGVPIAHDALVIVQVKNFQDFDGAAVGELIKNNSRRALEWSRLYKHGPANAFEYADGWTIKDALTNAEPSVVASLYMALEGARLTQASSGFFEADAPAECAKCGAQGCWHVRFELVESVKERLDLMADENRERAALQETGPP